MIKTELIGTNALKVIVPEKLQANDFQGIAPQVAELISKNGKIRIMVDATKFSGWENLEAFEHHAGFVKDHIAKVEKAALIAGHEWQHWIIGIVRIFAHPEAKAFDKGQEEDAKAWLLS